jgi:DNA-binding PucR family transcriptional regulator
MHAHTPPFTKSATGCDAKTAYDQTSKIAAAQDAKFDPGNDALPSILAEFRAVVKRLEAYAERLRASRTLADLAAESQKLGLYDDLADTSNKRVEKTPESVHGISAESSYLFSFGSSTATAAEIDSLRDLLTAEELKGFGIGDVHPLRHATLDERTPEDRL